MLIEIIQISGSRLGSFIGTRLNARVQLFVLKAQKGTTSGNYKGPDLASP